MEVTVWGLGFREWKRILQATILGTMWGLPPFPRFNQKVLLSQPVWACVNLVVPR